MILLDTHIWHWWVNQIPDKLPLNLRILKHSKNFRQRGRGLAPSEIAEAILTALTQGQMVGYQRQRPIDAVNYRGTVQYLAITVSENGFIVGANPATVP